jgi:5'(3')-deoxyribonucleotidase
LEKIVLDVDNVLADSISSWCRKASEYLGYAVSKVDIKSHKIVGSVPMSPGLIFRLQDEVWIHWKQLRPTEQGLPEKVTALRNHGFKIYIATARPKRSVIFVRKWLDHLRLPYDDFFALGPYRDKADIPSDALVDDAPEQVERFVRDGRIGFLYSQPWNCAVSISNAVTIHNFDELLRHLIV